MYARLSDDDPEEEKKKAKGGKDSDKESNSIQNQRTILFDYARQHGYLHPQFFYDDGVSGTTFEREGFRRMEELVEAGKVSTVIVKDLSRFGRNYLEVGNYLEVVYPTLGVNFVAIQENVDTEAGTGTEMISDERFAKLSATYETEQAELERANAELEKRLSEADKANVDLHMLLEGLREFSEVRKLTPTIVNKLIKRIEVHSNEKKHSHGNVKVTIRFTAAGIIDLPTEQQLREMMEEIKREAKSRRLSA